MERCSHCGLPITDVCIPGEDEAGGAKYCCHGCRMVAELLDDAADASGTERAVHPLLLRLFAGALMAAFVMVLSLAISSEYGFSAVRELEHSITTAHWVLLFAAVPALLLLGGPLLRSAIGDLREGRLTLNVLFMLGTSSAVGVSVLSYVRATGPIYLETATMLLALYTLGRYLTARAKGQTTRMLGRLLDVPDTTYERLDPHPEPVPPDALQEGDRVRIRAGDVVPVDGRILRGQSFIDESSLTGEARPVVKQAGDVVYAGTANLDGALVIQVTAVADERRLARVEAMMREALARPPRIMALTNRIMRWLIPGVVALSIATFAGWYVVAGFEKALYTSLSVVLITCPCALGLAIPLVLVLALGEASRKGILVRSGRALLTLARARTMLMDKTGTLSALERQTVTVLTPQKRQVAAGPRAASRPQWTREQLLQGAASIETGTRHILGTAIMGAAHEHGLALLPTEDVQTVPGTGVTGWVRTNGARHHVGVGREALLDALDADSNPALLERAQAERAAGRIALMVVVDRVLAGVLVLDEQVRDEAPAAVHDLRQQGVTLQVLTGDAAPSAQRLGNALDVPVQHTLTPAEKVEVLTALRQGEGHAEEPVVMVGDGINDAAVLAEADVGIALASGASISMEAADVTLYHPDLRKVAWLRRLAQRSARIVRQNLWWTFGYNAVGMGLAVAGLLHPIAAVVIMTGSSVIVTWNAFRVRKLPDVRLQVS